MPDILLQPHADQISLVALRAELIEVRAALAERESQAAELRAQLKAFEGRYLHQVGILYADLDDLEARIAEREVALYQSQEARERAVFARRQADETHRAAYGEAHDAPDHEPPPDLKALFRELARRIHPDFARDPEDRNHRTRLMARANLAYSRGDLESLQRLLDDHQEAAALDGEDSAVEHARLTRQLAQARRDIATLDAELAELPTTEIARLKQEADAAKREGRDLLTELATGLRTQIADAQYRYDFLERQLFAHGR